MLFCCDESEIALSSTEFKTIPKKFKALIRHLYLNGLISTITNYNDEILDLRSLTSAESLVLSDDFDLSCLYCADFAKEELIEKRKGR